MARYFRPSDNGSSLVAQAVLNRVAIVLGQIVLAMEIPVSTIFALLG